MDINSLQFPPKATSFAGKFAFKRQTKQLRTRTIVGQRERLILLFKVSNEKKPRNERREKNRYSEST